MSKLFKYLGIGTAIGTLAYAVIKYKHDEKFKEKVDTVVDKAADFAADHPILTTAVFATVVMVPIMAIRKAMDPALAYPEYDNYDENDEECDQINEEARMAAQKQALVDDFMDNPSDYLIVKKDCWDGTQKAIEEYENQLKQSKASESIFSNWKEDYRDSFDEVTELTKRITLHPGESYMIEEPRQFGLDTDRPVVSHLINGTGCYPPEVKDNQFIN